MDPIGPPRHAQAFGRKGRLALEILAADPSHQDPKRTDQGHDQRWEVDDLVDEYADRWAARHQAAQ